MEDIQQENINPNILKKNRAIDEFAEQLINNINEKLSQREAKKSNSRRSNMMMTNMFDQRASHRHLNDIELNTAEFKN